MWTPRRHISTKKDSSWFTGQEFLPGSSSPLLIEACYTHWISGTNHRLSPQAFCTVFLPTKPTLITEFQESSCKQWAETCPMQLEQHSYILICIFTDQAEQLSNAQFWSIRTVVLDQSDCAALNFSFAYKRANQKPGRNFIKAGLPFVSVESTYGVLRMLQTVWKLFTWTKFLLLLHPSLRTTISIRLVAVTFCWQNVNGTTTLENSLIGFFFF